MRRQRKKKTRRTGRRLLVESLESRAMLHGAGALSGSVFFDADGDGDRGANEVGIPGVVIELSASNSPNASMDRSTITDDNGIYTFGELEPGTYEVSKRQSPATVDSQDSTSLPGAVSSNNLISNLALADDQNLGGINFRELGLRPEVINISWFFASAPSVEQMLRETLALSEEIAGNRSLAASIRAGGTDVPDGTNNAPVATNDLFSVEENDTLTIGAASGVLANDSDSDGDSLIARLVGQASNGIASLNNDGSFTYTPRTGFTGSDSFTYQASDGIAASNLATARINVNPANGSPVAANDTFRIDRNQTLTVPAASGVLSNDTDADNDTLTASIVAQATNGSVMLSSDGSFTYTPNTDFFGADSFTYQASDGTATSNEATATINVNQVTNQPFAPVVPGSIDDPELLGTRMDTQPGAAPFTLDHTATAVDYTGFGNPPSYGPHHAVFRDAQGNSITPRPTGFYDTEQPDEDLVHNLEHGHVWISYNPSLISNEDHLALEQLVRGGGTDTGVILTPRSKNTSPIVLTSLTRQLTLDTFDATTVRDFVNTNRGHSPEGFIPSGQRADTSETLDDGLPHSA